MKRDLPFLVKILNLPIKYRVLKGRGNYLCHYRLEQVKLNQHFLKDEQLSTLDAIDYWQASSRTGELSECHALAESHPLRSAIVSTADNCLGQECNFIDDCFVAKARRRAQGAEILVINHHLFFSDLALQDDGLGELLPKADVLILDEAHQLAGIGSQYFGTRISSKQIRLLNKDSLRECQAVACDAAVLQTITRTIELNLRAMQAVFGLQQQRKAWRLFANHSTIQQAGSELIAELNSLLEFLTPLCGYNKSIENCHERCKKLILSLQELLPLAEEQAVQWLEVNRQQFSIHRTPLSIAESFQRLLQQEPKACIFTSATLSVNRQFDHFCDSLGIDKACQQLHLHSPFNYQQQSLLYLPKDLPPPNDPEFTSKLLEHAIPVIRAAKGRTFLLFTSYSALHIAENTLTSLGEFNVFVQGTQPKLALLDAFIATDNSVLLATNSFWQGVDVRGKALSCVIIDKLPFASPGDPVVAARIRALQQQGKNAFADYQLPEAIIQLKQGAGRLIRDLHDRGVLMLGDTRLLNKPYGQGFLNSLPPMPISHQLKDVQAFFNETIP